MGLSLEYCQRSKHVIHVSVFGHCRQIIQLFTYIHIIDEGDDEPIMATFDVTPCKLTNVVKPFHSPPLTAESEQIHRMMPNSLF